MTFSTPWTGYNPDKDALRQEIWLKLKDSHVALGNPVGHIPNFQGADLAAETLKTFPLWQQSQTIKCNPDSPHIPVRLAALQAGKRVYMAVPKLTNLRCFVELNPTELKAKGIPLEEAAIAKKALIHGKLVSFAEMQPIDLVTVGCVAVTREGGRTGKGAGFADLELAMLQEFNLIQSTTPIITTVHPLQIVDRDRLPLEPHDWPLDYIITPTAIIPTQTTHPRPTGLDWQVIRSEQYQKIPILKTLKATIK